MDRCTLVLSVYSVVYMLVGFILYVNVCAFVRLCMCISKACSLLYHNLPAAHTVWLQIFDRENFRESLIFV